MHQKTFKFPLSRQTRKRTFLDEMNKIVPWSDLKNLIEPHYPSNKVGRPAYALETMLRIHFIQQWYNLSDFAMEEALFDISLYHEFAQIEEGQRIPDETTILNFRHLLENNNLAKSILAVINKLLTEKGLLLKEGTIVDATIIHAPTSTKNQSGQRDPEMRSTKKGNQFHFGMKAHIGVDADSGLVHTITTTSAHVHDINEGCKLLHGQENQVFSDAGYRGIEKRNEGKNIKWNVAMMHSKKKRFNKNIEHHILINYSEKILSKIRAKVEFNFRVIKCQFGYVKVRYKGLFKNTQQLNILFALSNLYLARKKLLSI
jgi:IS5 family transposase